MQFCCCIHTGLGPCCRSILCKIFMYRTSAWPLTQCEAADSPLQGFMALGQLQLRAYLLVMLTTLCTVTLGTQRSCFSTKTNKAWTSSFSTWQSCLQNDVGMRDQCCMINVVEWAAVCHRFTSTLKLYCKLLQHLQWLQRLTAWPCYQLDHWDWCCNRILQCTSHDSRTKLC